MTKTPAMTVEPLQLPFDATLPMPGSKSHANRAIITACLAKGTTILRNATPCDDVAVLVANVRKMGFRAEWIDQSQGILKIIGGIPARVGARHALPLHAVTLDCGLAGTTLRFLTALCSITPGEWIVTGNARMQKRPIGDLTRALRMLGAEIEDTKVSAETTASPLTSCPPLRISGKTLDGGNVILDASKSSQFLSALLLIAPSMDDGLTLTLSSGLASEPYVDLTMKTLKQFGVNVRKNGRNFRVTHQSLRSPPAITVEGDWSAAGAFLVLEEITGSRINAPNLDAHSTQADAKLPDVIRKLRGKGKMTINCAGFPDQVMNIAVLAAHRKGETILTGAANLRLKESDRLGVLTQELRKAGIRIKERPDGLRILHSPKLRPALLDPHDDHRMAMAFAILGCLHPGIKILNSDCVRKSYPRFWKDLEILRATPRCIAIIGMRGVGKSTLGEKLAKTLRLRHVDTDAVFDERNGEIQSVLKKKGWPFFRRQEERIVAEHLQPGIVLSLGGGAIESVQTRAALQKNAIVVWMREPLKTVIERLRKLRRPALTDLSLEKEVPLVLKRRTPLYAALADITLSPSLTQKQQVNALSKALRASCSW
ncbi:MAG: 3-phosphoshikimate 1-carboxyvinyltransferase [Candidatus Peribacteraceae bacterium]|nr:3-phosphoshikimate 1-carboxyvinyltransferase [Candidatus Peribacteraceae bacterium]